MKINLNSWNRNCSPLTADEVCKAVKSLLNYDIYVSCVCNYEVLGKFANFIFSILQNTRLHSNTLLLTIHTFLPVLVLVLFPTSASDCWHPTLNIVHSIF